MSTLRSILIGSIAITAVLSVTTERADACTLPSVTAQRFWPTVADPAPGNDPERCDPNGDCHLSGYVYTPALGANFPAIVFVHGTVGDDDFGHPAKSAGPCEVINYFVDHGYVVFVPFGRGVRDVTNNAGQFTNTGTYVEDYTAANTGCTASETPAPDDPNCNILHNVKYMRREATDASLAIKWLANVPATWGTGKLVGKIALVGHSFGGATTLLASGMASLARKPDAFVALSGAAMSWQRGTSVWSAAFTNATSNRTRPLYLQQTVNESPIGTTDLTTVPFLAGADETAYDMQLRVFSDSIDTPTRCPTDYPAYHCAHVLFVTDKDEIERWAGAVVEFLARNGIGRGI